MRGSKLQEALHLLIRKLHFKTDGRIDGSQEAQGNRVTRKMDSCVSLKPHTPGKHHHTEKKKKGSVLKKAEPTAFVGKFMLTAPG